MLGPNTTIAFKHYLETIKQINNKNVEEVNENNASNNVAKIENVAEIKTENKSDDSNIK